MAQLGENAMTPWMIWFNDDKETQGLFIAFDQITKEEINVEFPLNDLEKIRSIQPRSNFRLDLSILRSIK